MPAFGRRVRLLETGFDKDLTVETRSVEIPAPQGKEVVVRVAACGVCYRDLIDRAGRIPFIQVPITPGHEAAGTVTAVGPEVTDWKVGDNVGTMHRDSCGECDACKRGETSLCVGAAHVFGILADGGYADYLVAPQSAFFSVPPGMALDEAALLHCTFGTAYRDLKTLGKLQAGERVLITGANGGVGSAGVQIAARLGASEVIAVIRDAKHEGYLRKLGATQVVVDPGNSFTSNPAVGKVDLVLDAVGVTTFLQSLRALRVGGRCVVVGNIVPEKVQLNLGFIITNGLTVIGGSGATRNDMAELLALHAAKPFVMPVDRKMPLEKADEAQRLVQAGGLEGRIILTT